MKNFFIIILVLLFGGMGCQNEDVSNKSINLEKNITSTENVDVTFENIPKLEENFDLPVLLYHHIGNSPLSASANARTWYVSTEVFEEHMMHLKNAGYEAITFRKALEYLDKGIFPKNAVVVNFDDGAYNFKTNAIPILEELNIVSSMNIMTGVKGNSYLSAEDIKELDKKGLVEFQSHTRYHQYLTRVSAKERREEMKSSKEFLEKLLGKPVEVLGYPFGLYNDQVIKDAKELGYKMGLTIKPGTKQDLDNLFEFKRYIITNNTKIENILPVL